MVTVRQGSLRLGGSVRTHAGWRVILNEGYQRKQPYICFKTIYVIMRVPTSILRAPSCIPINLTLILINDVSHLAVVKEYRAIYLLFRWLLSSTSFHIST